MNTYPVNIARVKQPPQVFAHNQKKFGYTVLIIQSSSHNDKQSSHHERSLFERVLPVTQDLRFRCQLFEEI